MVVGKPQPVGDAAVGEAPADDLVGAQSAQGVLGAAAQQLLAAEPADPLGDRRQRRGEFGVEVGEARDLLDQVGLALHVLVALGRARWP